MGNINLNVGKYELKTQYGASWVKLFYHHFDNYEDAFEKAEDALDVYNEKQYSIILEASKWPHDGPYEFLLQYPDLVGYNRWSQTNFPLNETDSTSSKSTVEGFSNISCTWTNANWGGLQRANNIYTLLEGSIGHVDWFYSIGIRRNISAVWGIRCLPGPLSCVYNIYLWMRIPDIVLLHHCTFWRRFHFRPIPFFVFFFSE